ncbi:hypothetical protein [Sinorhizobium medicae]
MEIVILILLSLFDNGDIPFLAAAKHGGAQKVQLFQVIAVTRVVVGRDAHNLRCDLCINWSCKGKTSRFARSYVRICIR